MENFPNSCFAKCPDESSEIDICKTPRTTDRQRGTKCQGRNNLQRQKYDVLIYMPFDFLYSILLSTFLFSTNLRIIKRMDVIAMCTEVMYFKRVFISLDPDRWRTTKVGPNRMRNVKTGLRYGGEKYGKSGKLLITASQRLFCDRGCTSMRLVLNLNIRLRCISYYVF